MITILVPTHNRHRYLGRVISYYTIQDLQLIIVDSSSSPYIVEDNTNDFVYLHYPNCSFSDKILKAFSYIEHKLVALCADDDFFYHSALNKATSVMNNNENIVLFTGEYEFFNVLQPSRFYPNPSAFPKNNILSNYSKEAQISHYMSNYSQILWSVYRKDLLFSIMKAVKLHNYNNDNYIELTVAALSFANGSVYFYEKYVGVREVTDSSHWGLRHTSISNSDKHELNSYIQKITKLSSSYIAKLIIDNYFIFLFKRKKLLYRIYRVLKLKLRFNKFYTKDRELVKKFYC